MLTILGNSGGVMLGLLYSYYMIPSDEILLVMNISPLGSEVTSHQDDKNSSPFKQIYLMSKTLNCICKEFVNFIIIDQGFCSIHLNPQIVKD